MVKIDSIKNYSIKKSAKGKKSSATHDDFILSSSDSATTTQKVKPVLEASPISQLMQLQEIHPDNRNNSFYVQQGDNLLHSLEQLQHDILNGTVSEKSLQQIIKITNKIPNSIDNPKLKEIILEIKQRAMIEITKIELSSN